MTAASSVGRIGVYGASGSGKTTKVKELLAARSRVVVFDPLGEYRGRGWIAVDHSADELALKRALAKRWGGPFKIAYRPRPMREPEDLHRLSRVLLGAQAPFQAGHDRRTLTLVVEELNLSFPVTALPAELSGFAEICSRGRHYGIEVIAAAQRLAEVNNRWRGNTSEAFLFRPGVNPRDLSAALELVGQGRRGELQRLQPHHFLHVTSSGVAAGRNKSLRT